MAITRKVAIAEICERKAYRCINKIDPDQIPQDRLARSARDLIDASIMTSDERRKLEKPEGDDVDTYELICRVKRHRDNPAPLESGLESDEDGGEIIDAESTEIHEEENPNNSAADNSD